ncbi:MAG: YkgJ family cysteine cluster protein [Thermoplasmata archaeon]|nr:YkgJ family cysteine cluster protein [Thermoplasmata archaeon]
MQFDQSLLEGFAFTCRPDCGLCCFANPAVSEEELPQLLQILPDLSLLDGEQGYHFLDNRPDGGACDLLQDLRCSAHAARPFPCRSFPISVHLGERAQASVVLSCPGLNLTGLDSYGAARPQGPPRGFAAELAAVRAELGRPEVVDAGRSAQSRMRAAWERFRASDGWEEPDELRAALRRPGPALDLSGYPEIPPSPEEGLDGLPLTFDESLGRVGLTGEGDEWTVLRFNEAGGGAPEVGTYALPIDPPKLDTEARRLIDGYLRYAFDRDAVVGQLFWELADARSTEFGAAFRFAVAETTAMVVTRSAVLAAARGEPPDHLGRDAVLGGIRASDADVLDRPTAGAVL